MKTWQNAEIVELNITETANGHEDSDYEYDITGWGTNDSLKGNGNTPDTLS